MIDRARFRPLWLLTLPLAATTVVTAEEETHRCASIGNDEARLECYDSAFGKPAAPGRSAPAPTAVAAAAAPPAPPATAHGATEVDAKARARDEFGLSEVDKRARNPEEDREPASITGQVVQIGYRPTGEMVVSLADGQVWTQIESDNRSRVKAGDSVTIRKGTLGSYLLVGPDRIAVRVRRIK